MTSMQLSDTVNCTVESCDTCDRKYGLACIKQMVLEIAKNLLQVQATVSFAWTKISSSMGTPWDLGCMELGDDHYDGEY